MILRKTLGAAMLPGLFEWTAFSSADPWQVHKIVGTVVFGGVLAFGGIALLVGGRS